MTGVALLPVFLAACALLVVAGKARAPLSALASLELLGGSVPLVAGRGLVAAPVALGVFAAIRPGPSQRNPSRQRLLGLLRLPAGDSCGGCRCTNNTCNEMLIDCNVFRYGRCNTQVGAMMPAFCGEVACQNPATVSGSNCKSSVAVDDVPSEGSLG